MGRDLKIAESQNASNEKIAQMNNEFNEKQFDKQIAYNWAMFQKQNEYNTAANQAARLRAAGINPYVAGLDGSTPAASGLGVSPPTASEVGRHDVGAMVNAYNNQRNRGLQVADQLNQSASQLASTSKMLEETKGIQIENMYKEQRLKNEIYESYTRGQGNAKRNTYQDKLNDYQQMVNEVTRASMPYDAVKQQLLNANVEQQTKFLFQQTSNEVTRGMMMKKEYQWIDKLNGAKLNNMIADTFLKGQQSKLAVSQVRTEVSKRLKMQAETEGLKVNNKIINQTADEIVKQTIITTKSMQGDYDVNNTYNDKEWAKVYTKTLNTVLGPVRSVLSPIFKAIK